MNEWDGNYNYNYNNYNNGYNSGGGQVDRTTKRAFLIIGFVFALVGLVLCIVGVIMLNKFKERTELCTGEAKATVIELDEHISEDDDGHRTKTYAPVVEYTVDGVIYEEMAQVHTSPCKYSVGDTVMVRYNPADPGTMIIEGDKSSKWLSVFLAGMGAFFFLLGIPFAIVGLKIGR